MRAQRHFQEGCHGLSHLQVLVTFALLTLHEITKVLVDWQICASPLDKQIWQGKMRLPAP